VIRDYKFLAIVLWLILFSIHFESPYLLSVLTLIL